MQRPWTSHYPSGVPANIDIGNHESLLELCDEAFKKYEKHIAFSCMDKDLTYKEVDKLSSAFAGYLQSRGLKAGDKFALMLPNILQYPIALFGAMKAGLVIVNTNPLYTPREIEHQLKDSGAKGIIIAENFAHHLEKVIDKTGVEVVITTSIGEMLGAIKGTIVDFAIRNIKRMVPKYNLVNEVPFKVALKQGKRFDVKKLDYSRNNLVALQYTGGTTGVSKGAMLSHGNIIANIAQMHSFWDKIIIDGKEVIMTALPLYHIFGFTVNLLSTFTRGTHNVLIPNARDLDTVIGAFKKYPVSLFTGVNTLFNALLLKESFLALDFSSLKLVAAGGMALQSAVAEDWKSATGQEILQGYGLTETSPTVSFNPIGGMNKPGTVGIPIPSTDIQIMDDEGQALPTGGIGELCVKGPQVMLGYYNKPEESLGVLKDGWLLTGDIASIDEDGYIKIVDRKKDMILVSGFNVYPNEIEDTVTLHPKIADAAAIGIPHDKSGEVVKLFVVKKDKSLTEDEVLQYCKENMTGYKVPKQIEFRDELPKTNVGKILRRALKEEESA